MTPQQRARISRSIDLTFRQVITEDEYEELAEAANWRGCPTCGDTFNVAKGFTGPMSPKGNRYCDTRCVEKMERELAPMIKPSSTGTRFQDWDI